MKAFWSVFDTKSGRATDSQIEAVPRLAIQMGSDGALLQRRRGDSREELQCRTMDGDREVPFQWPPHPAACRSCWAAPQTGLVLFDCDSLFVVTDSAGKERASISTRAEGPDGSTVRRVCIQPDRAGRWGLLAGASASERGFFSSRPSCLPLESSDFPLAAPLDRPGTAADLPWSLKPVDR